MREVIPYPSLRMLGRVGEVGRTCCYSAALKKRSKTFLQRSSEVEALQVHHLGPRRHEVFHELLLRVRARIDFREGAQLRVRTKNQVDSGAGPLDLVRLPVATLVHAFRGSGRLPLRAHVEKVDENVVRQRLWP